MGTSRFQPSPDADIIVLSDLHMGRGRNPETGRYYALEAFFYDEDFERFCHYLIEEARKRERPLTVVLNGDVFDLLRIEPEPASPQASAIEQRFGPPNTPARAAHILRQILAGHPIFVRGLAELLAAGHAVVMLAGNHDIEAQWEPVRAEIRSAVQTALAARCTPEKCEEALGRLLLRSWFYYVPGRIWVEHGCQYDPENAFRFLLRGKLTDVDEVVYAAEHDMPLGNFFQRYLYNGFGHITFIVPSTRANLRYMRWLVLNEPRFLMKVLASHLPFAWQVLRRLGKSRDKARQQLKYAHEQALERIAASTGLKDKLSAIDGIMTVRPTLLQAVGAVGAQLLKTLGVLTLAAFGSAGLWFMGLLAITQLGTGFGLRALLFLALNLVMLGLVAGTLVFSMLRRPAGVPGAPFISAAQRVVEILDVPIVCFGHTHEEVVTRLKRGDGGRAWYYNTGTWIAVFTQDVLLPRERVQYTFLRVRDTTGELLHWSPGRREPLQVILQDESADAVVGEPVAPPAQIEAPRPVPAAALVQAAAEGEEVEEPAEVVDC